MIALEVYTIALHLPEKEMERLYAMMSEKINAVAISKTKKRIQITDKQAIDYLLKNIFFKKFND